MANMLPCTISHIALEKEDDLFFQLPPRSGHYCVLWWKKIPLGHLFLKPGRHADAAEVRRAMLKAVEPAVAFYAAKHGSSTGDYNEAFLRNDHAGFTAAMETVFAEPVRTPEPGPVEISVIICTRNRAALLRRCLDQLVSQQWLPAEIIVVDNAPGDDQTRRVVAKYPGVSYHREPRPGLDIARNTGARLAHKPLVAYVDDDVLIHPGWTYRVWEAFQDPEIAAMTGLVIASSLDTESQLIFEQFWSFNRGYRDKLFDRSFIQKSLAEGPPVWEIGAGANMAFRKPVLEEVGYFDERLDVGAAGCSGDSEIWFRILSKGMRMVYTPRAVVYHEHRKELHALRRQLFHYTRGFAAAALIQQTQNEQAGYRKHLYRVLPQYYWELLKKGFPRYRARYRTVFYEIFGLLSGMLFFRRNRKKPSQMPFN